MRGETDEHKERNKKQVEKERVCKHAKREIERGIPKHKERE